jgi:NADH-quinone oxidoreductase subunit E
LNRLRENLGLSETKVTTDDLGFTVETVSCLGACGLAPVITINDKVYPAMDPEKVETLLAGMKKELEN